MSPPISENTGQNVGEYTGSHGSPFILPNTDNFFPNGDVNWDNPPSNLDAIGAQTFNGTTDTKIEFHHIDMSVGHALDFRNCVRPVVENTLFTNVGNRAAFYLNCSGIVFRNCMVLDTMQVPVIYEGQAVYLDQCFGGHLIESNWFERANTGVTVSGGYAQDTIIIRGNYCKNPISNPLVGLGGLGQFVGFQYANALTNVLITENVCSADFGSTGVEDWITTFRSGGTDASRFMVTKNLIQGSSPSRSGGGIMSGDIGAGTSTYGYITVSGNRLIDVGGYNLAIAGGQNITLTNNEMFSSIHSPALGNTNASIYVWRQGQFPGDMHSCEVSNNTCLVWDDYNGTGAIQEVGWSPNTAWDGTSPNHGTLAQGNVLPTGWNTNDWQHTAWDADGGYAGYDALRNAWKADTGRTVTDGWEYYPPE